MHVTTPIFVAPRWFRSVCRRTHGAPRNSHRLRTRGKRPTRRNQTIAERSSTKFSSAPVLQHFRVSSLPRPAFSGAKDPHRQSPGQGRQGQSGGEKQKPLTLPPLVVSLSVSASLLPLPLLVQAPLDRPLESSLARSDGQKQEVDRTQAKRGGTKRPAVTAVVFSGPEGDSGGDGKKYDSSERGRGRRRREA